TLLLPPIAAAIDGAARARRRRAGRRAVRRAIVWVLSCALPFAAAASFARVLGASGIASVPAHPLGADAHALGGTAVRTTSAVLLVLVLAWLARPSLLRSVTLRARPRGDVAGLALEHVLLVPAALAWSLAAGCTVAAVLVALEPGTASSRAGTEEPVEVSIRGPLTYAGRGSLSGTESALRR